jgi:DNA-binding response OmpR family regulator
MATRTSIGPRVLIIDDDEKLTTLLTEYLAQFGFVVQAVADPETGCARSSASRRSW